MGGSHETPFKMKGSGFYGHGNSSPAKHDETPHTEHHWRSGKVNTEGTRVVNEKGDWVSRAENPNLEGPTKTSGGKTQNISEETEETEE